MLILDVGCGIKPKGHVNIDTLQEFDIDSAKLKKTRNFVLADGMHLPFKNKAFDTVSCIMTLEHFIDPAAAIKDFTYVAHRAYLIVPNNLIVKDSPTHLYSWSQTSFHNLLKLFYDTISITTGTLNIQSVDHIFMKIINRIPLFSIPITRLVSKYLAINIYALCSDPRT